MFNLEKFDEFVRSKTQHIIEAINSLSLRVQWTVFISSITILVIELIANC